VPALVGRDGDEPRVGGRAEEEPENRDGDRERGDRDDRIHSLGRVVERPVALDGLRCPFTPMQQALTLAVAIAMQHFGLGPPFLRCSASSGSTQTGI